MVLSIDNYKATMLQYSDDFPYKLERYTHNIQSRHVVSWILGWIDMHLSNKASILV